MSSSERLNNSFMFLRKAHCSRSEAPSLHSEVPDLNFKAESQRNWILSGPEHTTNTNIVSQLVLFKMCSAGCGISPLLVCSTCTNFEADYAIITSTNRVNHCW